MHKDLNALGNDIAKPVVPVVSRDTTRGLARKRPVVHQEGYHQERRASGVQKPVAPCRAMARRLCSSVRDSAMEA